MKKINKEAFYSLLSNIIKYQNRMKLTEFKHNSIYNFIMSLTIEEINEKFKFKANIVTTSDKQTDLYGQTII